MLGAVVLLVRHLGPGLLLVEHAQLHAGQQQPVSRLRDGLLADQPLLHRLEQMREDAAAAQVAAVIDAQRGRFRGRRDDLVVLVNILDRSAVADDVTVELPFPAQFVLQQHLRGAGGFAVDAVIRAHDGLDVRFLNGRLERRQIRQRQIALGRPRVEGMPVVFRAAVHGVMLGRGDALEMLRVVALQAFDERHAHARRQERILAVGLMAAAPARIAEDVDVGRPHGQPLVDGVIAHLIGGMMLDARFLSDNPGDFLEPFRVEAARHADRLREHRGRAGASHAVQTFVPPVVFVNAKARQR